eukprot:Amastigsp_a682716_55.p2 type:complete len:151 gc:universal Amastigsp_a682716_55:393-845(+)
MQRTSARLRSQRPGVSRLQPSESLSRRKVLTSRLSWSTPRFSTTLLERSRRTFSPLRTQARSRVRIMPLKLRLRPRPRPKARRTPCAAAKVHSSPSPLVAVANAARRYACRNGQADSSGRVPLLDCNCAASWRHRAAEGSPGPVWPSRGQ